MSFRKSSGLYLLTLLWIIVFSTPVAYSADYNPLADTGQKFCFDAEDHSLTPCPGPLDPFYGQDGNYLGKPLSLIDNGDETVSDQNTGLMWLKNSVVRDDGIFSHEWPEALGYCEDLSHAGYTNWRLAEIFELQSLVNFARSYPAISSPISSHFNSNWLLWSATPIVSEPTKGWELNGSIGRIDLDGGFGPETICVRGENQGPGNFVDNGNSVTDTTTFITWQKTDDDQVRTWQQALSYCAHLTLDEENDWRLPDVRELSSIIDFSSYNPALNDSYFPTTMASHLYWSSTTSLASFYNGAWVVNFTNGETRNEISKDLMYATRCIRGGLVEYFSLSVVRAGTGSGDVQGETVPAGEAIIDCGTGCSDILPDSEVVRLTATPEPGSSFVSWGGDFVGAEDCEGDSGVCTLQLLEDTVVIAYFMPHMQLTVTKDGSGEGIILSSPAGILCGDNSPGDCDQYYKFGTEVALTAAPASGSSFWYWSGEGCSGNGECTVSMDRARSVTATFRSDFIGVYQFDVTKSGTGAGNITSVPEGIDCGDGDCTKSFPIGSEVTLTASSEPGSVFSGWKGFPCFGTSPTCVVTMSTVWTQDAEFTADTTSPRQLTVTIQDDALGHSGRVTSSPLGINCGLDCTELYTYKKIVTLTAIPDGDASFISWSGDVCTGSDTQCIVHMTSSWQVTANFGPASFNKLLTVTKDGNGLGTVTSSLIEGIDCGTDCSEIYPQNSEITLIATPAVGRIFIGWSGGGCSGVAECQITLLYNTTVNATFEMDPAMEGVFKDGFETE